MSQSSEINVKMHNIRKSWNLPMTSSKYKSLLTGIWPDAFLAELQPQLSFTVGAKHQCQGGGGACKSAESCGEGSTV
jgi:hypothetical protein